MSVVPADTHHTHRHDKPPDGVTSEYGHPGDPDDAGRIIEITAFDIGFRPESVTVHHGETIRFIVINQGDLIHELVIGTELQQLAHAGEMSALSAADMAEHMHGKTNGVLVPPGETREFTWTFLTDIEQLQFACHVPGHFEAGMSGLIDIHGN